MDEPQAATPQTGPRRRYTLSAKVLEANRHLEKARAVPKEIRYRSTERRLVACRQNLLKGGLGKRSASGSTRAWPRAVRWRVGWPGRGWPGSAEPGAGTLRRSECCDLSLGRTISSNFELRNKAGMLLKTKDLEKVAKPGTWNVYENKQDS